MANFKIAFDLVIGNEGVDSDDSADSGGLTRFGISQKAYPSLDIKSLTIEQSQDIYKRDYWDLIKGDSITDQDIANSIFDFGVNAGVGTSSKLAQKVVGVDQDGSIGNDTIYAINTFNPKVFIPEFKLAKIERYTRILDKDPTQIKFYKGWIKRSLK